jgi:hypothetical protein
MEDRNPYAPSRASLNAGVTPSEIAHSGVTVWRNENVLVMLPDSHLPPRCVKCNAPAEEPTKIRKVYWHHPAVYLLILLNLIIYAIVAAIVRKRALVAPGLCADHKRRRRVGLTVGWLGVIFAMAIMTIGAGYDRGSFLGLGVLLMLGSTIAGIYLSRIVVAERIGKDYVWLKGCGAEYLDSMPPLP